MSEEKKPGGLSKAEWLKTYVVGLGLGTAAAVYGVVALVMGRTFLPGLKGGAHTVADRGGLALAGGYLLGGVYLLLRYHVEKRVGSAGARSPLYWLQNLLLIGFIAALIYVLMHVGTVH